MLQKYLSRLITAIRLGLAIGAASVLVTGCGKSETRETGQFEPYVQQFEAAASERGRALSVDNISIRLGAVDSQTERAFCEIEPGQTPTIVVSPDAWNSSNESERQELLFHELGHCVLRRKHVEGSDEGGLPFSLMNPYKIESGIYDARKAFYLDELFEVRGEF